MRYVITALFKGEEHSREIFSGTLSECRDICKSAHKESCEWIDICKETGEIVEVVKKREVPVW